MTSKNADAKPTEHRKTLKKKWLIPSILITVGIIIIFLISTWLLLLNTRSNPAYQAAKPIEAALLKQGAVKKCETGDPGLGPDNDEPWYEAYYTVLTATAAHPIVHLNLRLPRR